MIFQSIPRKKCALNPMILSQNAYREGIPAAGGTGSLPGTAWLSPRFTVKDRRGEVSHYSCGLVGTTVELLFFWALL